MKRDEYLKLVVDLLKQAYLPVDDDEYVDISISEIKDLMLQAANEAALDGWLEGLSMGYRASKSKSRSESESKSELKLKHKGSDRVSQFRQALHRRKLAVEKIEEKAKEIQKREGCDRREAVVRALEDDPRLWDDYEASMWEVQRLWGRLTPKERDMLEKEL